MADFDESKQKEAKEYARRSRRLSVTALALSIIGLYLVLVTGFSVALQGLAGRLNPNPWAVVAIYFILGYTIARGVFLPFGLKAEAMDRSHGMSVQRWRSWAADNIKAYTLGLAFGLISVEGLYWTLRNFPTYWWAVAWGLGLLVALVVGYVAPVLLMPIFHRYERVEDSEMKDRLQLLARRAELPVLGVYKMGEAVKSRRALGALAGFGRTRRIILSDTLLGAFTPEEVESVVAHELGHQIAKDVGKGLAASAAYGLLALYLVDLGLKTLGPPLGLSDPSQVATLPLVALLFSLLGLASMPLLNFLSRRREARADAYALRLTSNPTAFASAMVKIHDQNLSDARSHPIIEALFYTHPSGHRRVGMAEAFANLTPAGPSP